MYEIIVQFPGEAWTINRRYHEFEALGTALASAGTSADELPALPPKVGPLILKRSSRDERQAGLAAFLEGVMDLFPRLECDALARFLGAPEEVAERQALLLVTAGDTSRMAEGESEVEAAQSAPSNFNASEATPASLGRTDATAEVVHHERANVAGAVSEAVSAEATDDEAPAELRDIRELRRQQWLRQQARRPSEQTAAPSAQASMASQADAFLGAVASEGAAAPQETSATVLCISLRPLAVHPEGYTSNAQFRKTLHEAYENLRRERRGANVVNGLFLRVGSDEFVIDGVESQPAGTDGKDVLTVTSTPLPTLKRVQFVCFKQGDTGDQGRNTGEQLVSEYIVPYFKSLMSEGSRRIVVSQDECLDIFGKAFYAMTLDPPERCGLIDTSTLMFAHQDEADEFRRIHIVPFSDTLPSAYDFDVFVDYVKPYLRCHLLDRFAEGQNFYHNGVQFKVVATDPAGSCRVGRSTQVFTEGCLHPTVTNLLSPDQVRRLALFPPGLQVMILQSDVFGDSDITERIIRAQERHEQAVGLTPTFLGRHTEESVWSQELRSRMGIEQTSCVVCLNSFVNGDRIRALPCKHVFHADCVDEWLGRDTHCPLCRHSFHRGA